MNDTGGMVRRRLFPVIKYRMRVTSSMSSRRIAVIALALVLLAVTLPAAMSDSEANITADDIIVIGVNNGEVSVGSNSSSEATFYVTNKTSSAVWIKVDVSGFGSDLTASSSITVDGDAKSLLMPYDDSDPSASIATVRITFSADEYADTASHTGVITFTANDVYGGDPSAISEEVSFTVNVSSVLSSGDAYNRFFGIWANTLDGQLGKPWFTALVTLILWMIATVIVVELIVPIFTRIFGNRKTDAEKKKLRRGLTRSVSGMMFFVAINECARILGAGTEAISMLGKISWVFYIVFGVSIAWQVYLFMITAFLRGFEKASDIEGMDTSLLPLFKMIGELVIGVAAVCAILSVFGVDLAGIIVSAGVVSLGITLGAQSTLNQFFSGIVLLATRPFKAGDFVRIGGETYIVRKVSLMYTEFKNWDGDQVVTMPNSSVSSATVINLTRGNPWTRIALYIDVAYGSDIQLCKSCLINAAKKHPHVIADGTVTPPSPRLTEFADSGITFKLAVWVDDFDNSAVYAGQIRELIYKELVDHGVEIPYNRLQVDILSEPSDVSGSDRRGSADEA